MTVRSGWLLTRDAEGGGQTREDTRVVPTGVVFPAGETTGRGGVVPGGRPFVLESAGAMEATVGVGRAVLQGAPAQGAYPVAVTEPERLVFADGDGQFPRVDCVVLRVQDTAYDASGQTRAHLDVVQGVPAPVPEAPVVDGPAEALYDVTVPAGASAASGIDWSSAVADRRRYTTGLGGILAGGADGRPGAYPGQYRDRDGVLERWSGQTWEPRIRLGSSGRLEWGDLAVTRSSEGALQASAFHVHRSSPASTVFSVKTGLDGFDRLRIAGDGAIQFGPGNAARDVTLFRAGPGVLRTQAQIECGMTRVASGVTAQSGWQVAHQDLRVRAGVSVAHVALTRTSATAVSVPASGNITPDLLIGRVPAAWQPPYDLYVSASTGSGDGSVRITTAGEVELLSWTPGASISQGATVRVLYTFIN